MLLPLLTVPYLVRIIGPERLGMLSFSQAYIAYFTLLINYGFEMSAVRAIAAHRSDRALVNRVFSEVLAGKTILWILSSILFTGLTVFVPEFRAHAWLHTATFISCLGYVLFPTWLYQAMEDLGRVAIFNLLVKLLFSASVLFFIKQPDDYIYQNLSLSVAQLAISVVALIAAFKRFGVSFTWPTTTQLRQRFRDDRTLFFSSLMITLYAGSTVFILGLIGSAYSVGIYSAGVRLESIARAFVGLALNQAFFPIAANAFGKSRDAGLAVIQAVFFPLLIFLAAITLALWVIAPVFIKVFYGPQFSEAIAILRIAAFLTVTIGISNLLGFHTMINLRMDRAFFIITSVGSVVGIVLTFLLVRIFDYRGATWAWVITEVYITGAMFIHLRRRGIQIADRRHFREGLELVRQQLHVLLQRRKVPTVPPAVSTGPDQPSA